MRILTRLVWYAFLGLVCSLPARGWEGPQFFGVRSSDEVNIIAWQADGMLVWSNAVAGVTATVFRASSLLDDTARMDFVEVRVTDDVTAVQVAIPNRPGLDEATRSALVTIPGGTFLMGDAMGDTTPPGPELPVHAVTIDTFQIGRYPVTKAEWDAVYAWAVTNGYDFVYGTSATEPLKQPDHPAGDVTWYDAVKWCNAKSEREGLTPRYTVAGEVFRAGTGDPDCDWEADGYRLPTEAEWEYAARGGLAGRRFPWGNRISHFHANYEAVCDADGHIFPYDDGPACGYHPDYAEVPDFFLGNPVNAFPPNGYGLYDMAGNHWNWCWDWYDEGYYANSPDTNPRGPAMGTKRTLRGGEMLNFGAQGCRVAKRLASEPHYRTYAKGFRVARNSP